jgi:nuclear pore complex protein Nup153
MDEIVDGDIKEINKNISGRRSIRDNYNYEEISSRKKVNNNEDRSISEPPQSRYSSTYTNNHNTGSGRLKTIREKQIVEDIGSSEDEEDFSKSNSQLNESDLDLEIPESASHTPTPTLLTSKSRRINSETNLNDSKRRLTGFMGNRSKRFCASTSELNFASHLDTHKSLFSPKNNQNSRSGSLFGSNMSLNSTNSRLFVANSPFYNGKTTFGGASAYPRRDINQHKVLRTPIQMRPSSSLSNSSNTSTKSEGALGPESNAAKRILEIMTQFSGPLKETRNMGNNINSMIKIPGLVQTRKRFGDEDLQLDRSISLTRPTAPYSRPLVSSRNQQQPESPSILLNSQANAKTPQIPTMSQLLKMKRLQNSTERVREIANRSESFLNQTHEYKLPSQNDDLQSNNTVNANSSSSSSSFKMKSNITKNLLRNDKGIDELPATPLNLPNIQLPELKSIPKFDIKLPNSNTSSFVATTVTSNNIIAPKSINLDKTPSIFSTTTSLSSSTMFKTATEMTTINQSTEMIKEKIVSKVNNSSFIFSKPIRLSVSDADYLNLKVTTDSFKFSQPILIDDEMDSSENVLEIQPTKPVTDNLFKNLVAQQKSQSWECDSCMTRNDFDKTKCLCCDSVRRDSGISSKLSSTSSIKEPSSAPPTDDLFKTLAAQQKKSQWDCTECFSKNDLDKEKCLCCETPKPGSKPLTTTTSSSSGFKFGMPAVTPAKDDLFKNLAAQQKKANWECSECMTSNDVNKEKCACCEAPKPGSQKAPSQTSSFAFGVKSTTSDSPLKPQFSFGMPASTPVLSLSKTVDADFKKIVEKQSANWECSACMTRNDQSKSKCICCEQAKPGSSENKSQFSFGSKVSSSISLPAPSEVKFSFGAQPVKSDTALTKDENNKKNDEKVDEVDKPKQPFSFGAANNTSSTESSAFSAPSFTFKSPQASTVNASFIMKSPNTVGEKKKEEEIKEKSDTTDKGTEKTSMFSFGSKTDNVPEKKVAFDIQPKVVEEKLPEKVTEEKKAAGGFSFPITSTNTLENANSASKTNGGFSFGGFAKPETKEDNKPASSGGFQFGAASTSSPFSSTSSTASVQPTSTFAFGSPKIQTTETSEPQKPAIFGSFGNTAQQTNASPFSSTSTNPITTSSTPVFGQNAASTFSFGGTAAKKDENTPIFAFGNAKPAANSNMVFGSSTFASSASTPSVTPMFGANPTPTFGSNLSSNNNNNEGFGSKMVGFGGIQSTTSNQSQKRAFDFGSSDVPQKKFDFGQQQPQVVQQSSSAPFQFNAQGNAEAVKPAFSFSATPAPQSFNFTGVNSNANNNVGNNIAQTQSPQPAATNIMQFGATSAPTVAIQGINAFGAQSAANTPQRKILRAARRATRR